MGNHTEHGEHKRDKLSMYYWGFIGLCIGLVVGASTHDWILSVISGVAFGAGMALFATKKGVDTKL